MVFSCLLNRSVCTRGGGMEGGAAYSILACLALQQSSLFNHASSLSGQGAPFPASNIKVATNRQFGCSFHGCCRPHTSSMGGQNHIFSRPTPPQCLLRLSRGSSPPKVGGREGGHSYAVALLQTDVLSKEQGSVDIDGDAAPVISSYRIPALSQGSLVQNKKL